jgi:hypothetical protein
MTDVLSTVQVVMQSANYRTWEIRDSRNLTIGFEDEVTMGFVSVFATPRQIIDNWRETEATLLARFAAQFGAAGDKAWNVYCVFVTEARSSDEERRSACMPSIRSGGKM